MGDPSIRNEHKQEKTYSPVLGGKHRIFPVNQTGVKAAGLKKNDLVRQTWEKRIKRKRKASEPQLITRGQGVQDWENLGGGRGNTHHVGGVSGEKIRLGESQVTHEGNRHSRFESLRPTLEPAWK